jgi:cell division protein FtsZ
MGILTVGIVTRPFSFEGMRRIKQAEEGIARLREKVDALLIIPNERLKLVSEQKITFQNAFEIADNVLRQAIQSISELITVPGLVNLDFADVETIMKNAGYAHMGVGRASGKSKAADAAKMAIQSPLLETSIDGARGVILNVTGSPDMGLEEVEEAAAMVRAAAHQDVHIIFGAAIDDTLDDEIRITVVATGFDENARNAKKLDDIFTSIKHSAEEKAQEPAPAAPVIPEEKTETPASVLESIKLSEPEKPAAEVKKDEEDDDPFEGILRMFRDKK